MTNSLLEAVCNSPYDDAPRLAYAAWLESQTPPDPLGEFMRVAIRCVRESLADQPDVTRWSDLNRAQSRYVELLQQHEYEWKRPVLAIAEDCELERGLVAAVRLPAERFMHRGAELFRLAPIVHVELTDVRSVITALAACDLLARVRSLSLAWQRLTSSDIAIFASSPHVSGLWALELVGNDIDIHGIRAMATSPHLKGLRHTELAGNPGDVHERAGWEMDQLVSLSFPPEGEALEAQLGRIPWLHLPSAPASRFSPPPP